MDVRQILTARASLFAQIRNFFAAKEVVETDTAALQPYSVTDPYMSAMQAVNNQGKSFGYLQTSPEYAMKRLLAAGSGDIYQLSKAYRADESGQFHSPEFTLLEWYRVGFSLEQLIAETYQLINQLIDKRPLKRWTYSQAFEQFTGLNPLQATDAQIKNYAQTNLADIPKKMLRDNYLSLIFSEIVEAKFDKQSITVITHYPPGQASLAKLVEIDGFKVAERFEIYAGNLELANGFHELTDAHEQLQRFEKDNLIRKQLGLPQIAIDQGLIQALKNGLPDCCGVAMGIDRLLMLKLKQQHINNVLPLAETK